MWLVHRPQALGAHPSVLTSLLSVSYTNYNLPGASLSHFFLWPSISVSSLPTPPWPLQQNLWGSQGSALPLPSWFKVFTLLCWACSWLVAWLLFSSRTKVIWAVRATATKARLLQAGQSPQWILHAVNATSTLWCSRIHVFTWFPCHSFSPSFLIPPWDLTASLLADMETLCKLEKGSTFLRCCSALIFVIITIKLTVNT